MARRLVNSAKSLLEIFALALRNFLSTNYILLPPEPLSNVTFAIKAIKYGLEGNICNFLNNRLATHELKSKLVNLKEISYNALREALISGT